MPHFTINISQAGPLLDVLIGVSQAKLKALIDAGNPVPKPMLARALVDTGASCTVIDPETIKKLGLKPTGIGSTITATTGSVPHDAELYDISLLFQSEANLKVFPAYRSWL